MNRTPVNIRQGVAADIPQILRLELGSPTAAHWNEQRYRQVFGLQAGDVQRKDAPAEAMERVCLVAEAESSPGANAVSGADSGIVGLLVARRVDREWELENIVVTPASRRTGLGTGLLEGLLARVRAANGDRVFLEVRESNTAARKLYEKMGFEQRGRRKAYYSSPQEDALLYRWIRASEREC
jgi:[ribosomal protein S18]-alanine N-acetyltransferase